MNFGANCITFGLVCDIKYPSKKVHIFWRFIKHYRLVLNHSYSMALLRGSKLIGSNLAMPCLQNKKLTPGG